MHSGTRHRHLRTARSVGLPPAALKVLAVLQSLEPGKWTKLKRAEAAELAGVSTSSWATAIRELRRRRLVTVRPGAGRLAALYRLTPSGLAYETGQAPPSSPGSTPYYRYCTTSSDSPQAESPTTVEETVEATGQAAGKEAAEEGCVEVTGDESGGADLRPVVQAPSGGAASITVGRAVTTDLNSAAGFPTPEALSPSPNQEAPNTVLPRGYDFALHLITLQRLVRENEARGIHNCPRIELYICPNHPDERRAFMVTCGKKHCALCAGSRKRRVTPELLRRWRRRLEEAGGPYFHLTLNTALVPPDADKVFERIEDVKAGLRRFRNTAVGRRIEGMIWAIDFHGDERGVMVHLHGVGVGDLRADDRRAMHRAWRQSMGAEKVGTNLDQVRIDAKETVEAALKAAEYGAKGSRHRRESPSSDEYFDDETWGGAQGNVEADAGSALSEAQQRYDKKWGVDPGLANLGAAWVAGDGPDEQGFYEPEPGPGPANFAAVKEATSNRKPQPLRGSFGCLRGKGRQFEEEPDDLDSEVTYPNESRPDDAGVPSTATASGTGDHDQEPDERVEAQDDEIDSEEVLAHQCESDSARDNFSSDIPAPSDASALKLAQCTHPTEVGAPCGRFLRASDGPMSAGEFLARPDAATWMTCFVNIHAASMVEPHWLPLPPR